MIHTHTPLWMCVCIWVVRDLGTGLFTFIFLGSLACCCICLANWTSSFWGLSCVWLPLPVGTLKLHKVPFVLHKFWGCEWRSLDLASILPTEPSPPPTQQTCYLLMKQAWGRKDQILNRREMEMEKRNWIERSKRRWKCILSHVLEISLTLRILHTSFPWSRQCRWVWNECVESVEWEGPQKTRYCKSSNQRRTCRVCKQGTWEWGL